MCVRKICCLMFFFILASARVYAIEKIEKADGYAHIITRIIRICNLEGRIIAEGDKLCGCKLDVYSAHSDIALVEDVVIGACGEMEFSIPISELPFKRERHFYCKKKGGGEEWHGVPVLDYKKNPYVISQCSINGWVARKGRKGAMPHNMRLLGEEYYVPSLSIVPDIRENGTKVPWYLNDPDFWAKWESQIKGCDNSGSKKDCP